MSVLRNALATLGAALGLLLVVVAAIPSEPGESPVSMGTRILLMLLGVALLALVLFGLGMRARRRLSAGRDRCEAALSKVEPLLGRRRQLVEALMLLVEGQAGSGNPTLERLQALTSGWRSSGIADTRIEVEKALGPAFLAGEGALSGLEGKRAYMELREELEDAENAIAAARAEYNDAVREHNSRIGIFPASMMARAFRVSTMEYL